VRLAQQPFPLYPGEMLQTSVTRLTIVEADSALHLRAVLDFVAEAGDKGLPNADADEPRRVVAGEEWLFEGPGTYIPRVEVEQLELRRATLVGPNEALRLRALTDLVDRNGQRRRPGEEWLMEEPGAYLPGVYEEVVEIARAYVLTEKVALHLRATRSFTDRYGKGRKTGEEWLITFAESETHIPSVYEEVVNVQDIITLTNRQYVNICNPVDADGKSQLGKKTMVKGPSIFFLQPGESLESGVQDIFVLGEDEGIILRANESFTDDTQDEEVLRQPGDRWMIRGPAEYVPPVEVAVVQRRSAIPLDDNEGIYVRNTKTGKVRAIIGQTYMLDQHEELFQKELPPLVEGLLSANRDALAERSEHHADADAATSGRRSGSGRRGGADGGSTVRDKTRVISYRVPHNAAVQVYDYKEKKARVVFGPDLVMLGPDEQFTVLSLSGGKPKRPNQIKALCLLLGPDFCTDIITIETADHARLQLQVSYNWRFDITDAADAEEATKLFSVPDFIGDLCKAVASRVRGAVASVQFDDFHKNSAKIIRSSVFGLDERGKVRESFGFPSNKLLITSIDIQSAEPVDQRTRDALQKSVQLAIEITTNSQEAAARHEAERLEQAAKGALERQKIEDEADAEDARKRLLELQALSAAVESSGQAKAEAQSRAEAARIESNAAVEQATLKAQAMKIEGESELERLQQARSAELDYIRQQNELEIAKSRELMEIETVKFSKMVGAIGPETLASMASAGPRAQAELLKGLGISTTLITDGHTPLNLYNTARGLMGGAAGDSGH
jgi:major vault protein